MKKLFMVLGMGVFLTACDRSIEGNLESTKKGNESIEIEKVEKVETKKENVESNSEQAQSKETGSQVATEKTAQDDKVITKKIAESETKSTIAKLVENEPEKEESKTAKAVRNNAAKADAAPLEQAKQGKVVRKADVKQAKVARNSDNGVVYENNKRISNFSAEELRVGAQKSLTKDEIQYFKSICRYALMSEQEIIDNRCEAKRVTISK